MTKAIETTPVMLTVEQAAQRMNMSGRHVRRLVTERRIGFYRYGRAIRVSALDVDAYIAAARVDPASELDQWRGLGRVA